MIICSVLSCLNATTFNWIEFCFCHKQNTTGSTMREREKSRGTLNDDRMCKVSVWILNLDILANLIKLTAQFTGDYVKIICERLYIVTIAGNNWYNPALYIHWCCLPMALSLSTSKVHHIKLIYFKWKSSSFPKIYFKRMKTGRRIVGGGEECQIDLIVIFKCPFNIDRINLMIKLVGKFRERVKLINFYFYSAIMAILTYKI